MWVPIQVAMTLTMTLLFLVEHAKRPNVMLVFRKDAWFSKQVERACQEEEIHKETPETY